MARRRRTETTDEDEEDEETVVVVVVEGGAEGMPLFLLLHPLARGRMPKAEAAAPPPALIPTPRADVFEEARRPMDPGDQRAVAAAEGTHIAAIVLPRGDAPRVL